MAAALALLCAAVLPFLLAPLVLAAPGSATSVAPGPVAAAPFVAAPVTGTPVASTPVNTVTSTGAPAATDPDHPYAGFLKTTITRITPTVVTSSTGPSITVTGSMTNTSKGTLYDLTYVWQRSNALTGVPAIKAEIARPSASAAVVGEDSSALGPTAPPRTGTATQQPTEQVDLAPGATAAFVATVAVGSDGLKIDTRGVYALTVAVTGDIGQNGDTRYERVGEIHLLGTVLSVPLPALPTTGATTPSADPDDRAGAGPVGTGRTAAPVPAAVLWPVVDTPHLGVNGIFLDDSLARRIAPDGRLFRVLSALDTFATSGASVTLVVDPQLLEEIATMAGGYRVVASPGAPQAALTPTSAPSSPAGTAVGPSSPSTSTGGSGGAALPPGTASAPPSPAASSSSASSSATPPTATTGTGSPAAAPPAGTVVGTGQAAAAAFLDRLRAAARIHQVLVLPYSDPDSVAMMRAGLDDQLAALVTRGRTVATRVLQVQPGDPGLITDTLLPAGGAVNDATVGFLAGQGISHAVLSPTTVQHAGGPVGAVTIAEPTNRGAQLTAALTDADVLPQLSELVTKGRSAGLATRLSTVAALVTGGSLDGTGTPLVVLPDRRWSASAAGLKVLGGLLRTLATGQVVAAKALPALTATANTMARLAYSGAAESAELPPEYLAQVMADNAAIAAIGGSLTKARSAGSPDPADVLDPLRTALSGTAASAVRTDRGYGARILQTVGATLDGLRAEVTIVSQSPSTLAASTAPLLITVRNDLPYSVRVKVVVIDGESVGMTTKDPALEDIPEGGSHQFRIDASVVKTGRFQVHAQIKAADGSNWSAPTTITVSSSAYGALTIVLVAVAGGALTLMVALRLVQRVRNRSRPSEPLEPVGAGDGAGPEPDSILAAANESTLRPDGGTGAPGNRDAGDASVPPASPTAVPPLNEQGEPSR